MVKDDSKRLVLVIEDEEGIRKFVCQVLKLEGGEVLETDSGERGMELMRQHKCSLVLLDLRLPGRDGWSILEEMKGDEALSEVPVIVFTASADISQRYRAFDMGAADYLLKPVSAAKLSNTISRVLKGARREG